VRYDFHVLCHGFDLGVLLKLSAYLYCCTSCRCPAAENFNKAVLELEEKAENLVPTPVRVPWQIKYHLLMLPDDGGKAGSLRPHK
jgi:hypothetical protein